MGTNYYLKDHKTICEREGIDDMSPFVHIGKRSAAGPYCWDCDITLCVQGNQAIHYAVKEWHTKCPKCGKPIEMEDIHSSSGGRELGFNKKPLQRKTGVKSCCSWTWAMDGKYELATRIIAEGMKLQDKCIVDEYGREYTSREFLAMIDVCPVHFDCSGDFFS